MMGHNFADFILKNHPALTKTCAVAPANPPPAGIVPTNQNRCKIQRLTTGSAGFQPASLKNHAFMPAGSRRSQFCRGSFAGGDAVLAKNRERVFICASEPISEPPPCPSFIEAVAKDSVAAAVAIAPAAMALLIPAAPPSAKRRAAVVMAGNAEAGSQDGKTPPQQKSPSHCADGSGPDSRQAGKGNVNPG